MWSNALQRFFGVLSTKPQLERRRAWHAKDRRVRPRLECLEDRLVPATYSVADGDVAGLIGAINDAQSNHAGEANTILLAPGGTYTLTGIDNTTNGANGLPAITIGPGSLTIDGGSSGATITRDTTPGTPEFRFFMVNSGDLTLNNLTLSNGIGTGAGGAIRLQSGKLALDDVTVSNNSTDGASAFAGGGIFIAAGTATIANSLIASNTSGPTGTLCGGGIGISGGTVTLTDSDVSGNTSKGTGGGISITGGSLTITRGTISNNNATADGGGIFKVTATLNIDDSVISNNKGIQGGGVSWNSGLVTITSSTISGNEALGANGGGGIFFQNGSSQVAISDSLISGNTASNGSKGGGIRINNTNTASTITNCTISGNSATGDGGGLYLALATGGTFGINNSTITNNTADSDNAGGELGGGIKVFNVSASPTINLTSTIVAGNFVGTGITAAANDIDRTAGTGSSTLNAIYCLIQSGSGAINGTDSNNIVNQDAGLASLADNDGPTWTHALLPGSPALDHGSNPLLLTTDQRGFFRVVGTAIDIGAYEAPPMTGLALSATTINENDSTALSGTFADLDTLETHTVTINWGDGSALQTVNLAAGVTSFSGVSHQYLDDNPSGTPADVYLISATVTGADGSTSATTSLTVNNVAPTLSAAGNQVATDSGVATAYHLGSFTDPGTQDSWTITVNWGDGTPVSTIAMGNTQEVIPDQLHTYAANGIYTVTVMVQDDDGGQDAKNFQVAVTTRSTISMNFNNTPIGAGKYIWFNSVLSASKLSTIADTTIWFVGQTITLGNTTLAVPDAKITFHQGTGTSTTVFSAGAWHTNVYLGSGLSGNQFLSGLGYYVPTDLARGIKNVTWSGLFFSDQPGVSLNWKWGAAVYTALPTAVAGQPTSVDYTAMLVKPADEKKNSDHAGTPEGYVANNVTIKSKLIAGATGGGGSNWTGSYSATKRALPLEVLDAFFAQL